MTKIQNIKQRIPLSFTFYKIFDFFEFRAFGYSNFGFVSDFDIRYSNLFDIEANNLKK